MIHIYNEIVSVYIMPEMCRRSETEENAGAGRMVKI